MADGSFYTPLNNAFYAVMELRETLSDFIPPKAVFVSLGQNCSSAWYLKSVGVKQASLPFDWIFSSPGIVAHCIDNDFEAFLDKKQMTSTSQHAAGHALYHTGLFAHRNPLSDEATYSYYERCVDRFRKLFQSATPLVFVSTLLPEHGKRPLWTNGFVKDYAIPANQNPEAEYAALQELIGHRPGPSRLILVCQTTETGQPHVSVTHQSEDLAVIRFDSKGANDGLRYLDPSDDTLCKALYATICYPKPGPERKALVD